MKDGFDKSVAERMPKVQKKRPNRPWNVDPVLLKSQDDHTVQAEPVAVKTPDVPIMPVVAAQDSVAKAVETIEDLNTEFTQIIFEKKDIQRKLKEHNQVLEVIEKENSSLKMNLAGFEKAAKDNKVFEREISFLNEQLEDADYYIRNVVGMLDEKATSLETETTQKKTLEDRMARVSKDVQDKAKLDVKVSILERDLSVSTGRIKELESRLEEEYRKKKPLEDEISELKTALDRVYSSLAHIRLKAKREVYGS
jgi:predicted  nucleic acid-binding Zn-ribbon protein